LEKSQTKHKGLGSFVPNLSVYTFADIFNTDQGMLASFSLAPARCRRRHRPGPTRLSLSRAGCDEEVKLSVTAHQQYRSVGARSPVEIARMCLLLFGDHTPERDQNRRRFLFFGNGYSTSRASNAAFSFGRSFSTTFQMMLVSTVS